MALTFAEIRFALSRQWDGGPLGLGLVAPKMSWSGVGIHVHVATIDMAGKAGELYTPYSCLILSKTETNGHTAANVMCIDFDHIQMLVGSCLATKAFIGNLPAMGRGWVIIK